MGDDRPYTPAELETAVQSIAILWGQPGTTTLQIARTVLDAVLPDHDARVRAEAFADAERELVDEARRIGLDLDGSPDSLLYVPAIRTLRRLARAHATTEGDPS